MKACAVVATGKMEDIPSNIILGKGDLSVIIETNDVFIRVC